MNYNYSYGKFYINETEYNITLNSINIWVLNLCYRTLGHIENSYRYKDIIFSIVQKPYKHAEIQIYWCNILVLSYIITTYTIDEFHFDEIWIEQFLELYEEKYAMEHRKHIQELVAEQLIYEKEQHKKFLPLKDI